MRVRISPAIAHLLVPALPNSPGNITLTPKVDPNPWAPAFGRKAGAKGAMQDPHVELCIFPGLARAQGG